MQDKKGKEAPLSVRVENGELNITIGISTLKWALQHSDDHRLVWLDEDESSPGEFMTYDVTDEEVFANDVMRAIETETCTGGDGTTFLHLFLEDAMFRAIEDGSIAIGTETIKVP